MARVEILIVPGWGNSGPEHWQSLFARELPNARRVEQREWINVDLNDWIEVLDRCIRESSLPVVLVAHSLSCILVAHWARVCDTSRIHGALLVAPTDVENPATTPPETTCFAPIPLYQLPFTSVMVASSDDPYTTLDRAAEFAAAWGSTFVNLGAAGHINVAAGYGPWPRGREILSQLIRTIDGRIND